VLTFLGALVCFWTDNVDSRFLQAAVPDACFVHGVVHAARMALTGQWRTGQGISVRTPAPLPPLTSARSPRPSVLVVLTESVRADTLCSDPPPRCRSEALDAVASERIPLGRLTTQTPNTFSACVTLWTGVGPDVDFASAHSAPVLWEIARAVGYRTAYVTSQNTQYEDFGAFVSRAGIDTRVTAIDLGGMGQEQLGAPDERATAAMLLFVRDVPAGTPYFAVLHLSNTHAPYRVDPAMQPHEPHASDPLGGVEAFRNQDRNAVLLQERTVASFLGELRARPGWDDTVVLFVSDHGEQFREHGGLYHNHSLYEEELRVPGWLLAGPHALSDEQRSSLAALGSRRTYLRDVHETVVDLLGVEDARARLPLAGLVEGRSLLRPLQGDPSALLATSTAVWEPDDARFGVISGNRVLIGSPNAWQCFDTGRDPGEERPLGPRACVDLLGLVRERFVAAR
jgi:membrane-anchored protein YejM (alkaline phosphatase superfamily)